jgi:DNA adenine methylase
VLQRDFSALEKEIAVSLHSRSHQAAVIYNNPEMFDRVKRAWAVWILANMGFGSMLNSGFGFDMGGRYTHKLNSKRDSFSEHLAIRIQNAQIECCDALRIIRSKDEEHTFFYLDPPYIGADQGHYDGYTQEDFDALLQLLEAIKGTFLLSSYRNKSLAAFTKRNGWHTLEFSMSSSMTHGHKTQRHKIEVLTANYPLAADDDCLQTEEQA